MERSSNLISIVAPAFNEGNGLVPYYEEIKKMLDQTFYSFELIFVNDGSSDQTLEVLKEIKKSDERIGIINLSRNFGKENAVKAGLDHARGEAVVVMDADLEHPPHVLLEMLDQFGKGYDVVFTRAVDRKGQNYIRKKLSSTFYDVINKIAGDGISFRTGDKDFILLSRKAVNALLDLNEYNRFSKGLFKWIGFNSTEVTFEQGERLEGESKWSIKKLAHYSIDAITSFSFVPLRFSSYMGMIVSSISFIYMIYIIVDTIVNGSSVAGFPTLVTLILFLSGVILISLGIMGEYLARIFIEVKKRPIYLIEEYQPSEEVYNKRTYSESKY
ncbi:glycosyltransferase family 2 protein [Bacillus sp. RAR_GA_16]|uniref:glycosyltransferase family 2 protein n=1 Tax=Bacillus sp. RAR_GA_16 TaxID=2876774 RepID=UPI001CCB3AE4|nr:glycosyltransferase family 2 protein [Bacillus sp. RAR_GA_16]MCA0172213.1 glycosyltransferase family 2 protein [Bacillus sp. RAR_GA_16]